MRFSVARMWSCSQTALLPRLFEFVRGALQKGIFCRLCIQLHRLCPPFCGLRRDWYRRSVSDFGLSSVGGTQVPVCICRTGEPHRIPLAWHRFLQWLKGLRPRLWKDESNRAAWAHCLNVIHLNHVGSKSAHTALAVKACLLGGKTATLNAQSHLLI